MARIFISYGITKSASTFAWQLIKRIAIAGGLPVATLTKKSKGASSPEDYIDPISDEKLALIHEDVGESPVIIKTHGDVTPTVARLVADGTARVFVSYRDPRDIALSLLDHGAKSREKGIKDFAEFYEITDTLDAIRTQVSRFGNWVRSCAPLLIPYDEICFDTRTTISKIANRLQVPVDVEKVLNEFSRNKNLIGQFNRGERRRFEREMDEEVSRLFVGTFADYYSKYFPEELVLETTEKVRESDSVSSSEEMVTAAYKAVLGRAPDPGGLAAYSNCFKGVSTAAGVERVVSLLLKSKEFTEKRELAEVGGKPELAVFTPELLKSVRSGPVNTDTLLIAVFNVEPRTCPKVYLNDLSSANIPRFDLSSRYIADIISRYVLGEDYYHRSKECLPNGVAKFQCIFQVSDSAREIPHSIAYSAKTPEVSLIPDLHFWMHKGYFWRRQQFVNLGLSWSERFPTVFWRGSSTGDAHLTMDSIRALPRFRLCEIAKRQGLSGKIDAKLSGIVQATNPSEAGNIRGFLLEHGMYSQSIPLAEFVKYRFQVDIDGNVNSWSFFLKLAMGSCVLKVVSDWQQWYYDELRPWEHYVPVKNDLSDFEERVEWCLNNDEAAQEIAANALRFTNGIVFGSEMARAAEVVIKCARSFDG
jgi:hypothetical protein